LYSSNILVAIHETMSVGCNSDDKAMVKITNNFLQCAITL